MPVALLFIGSCLFAQSNQLNFENFTTANGLSNNRVYSIIQDSKGFMWFGTLDGLSKYDGYSFIHYKNRHNDIKSLKTNRITLLFEDTRNQIWLGTLNDGINRFDPVHEEFTHFDGTGACNSLMRKSEVKAFRENKDGQILMYYPEGVCVYDYTTNNITFKGLAPLPPSPVSQKAGIVRAKIKQLFNININKLQYLDDDDELAWIGSEENGLFMLNKKTNELNRYIQEPFDANFEINALYRDRSGCIWIGTRNNGVYKHIPASRNFVNYNRTFIANNDISDFTVRALTCDLDGNIWIGTHNKGLIKYNRKTGAINRFQEGGAGDKIRSLYTDYKGNVWIGTYYGVRMFDRQRKSFEHFSTRDYTPNIAPTDSLHLYYNRVYNFCSDHFGNIWMANWKYLTKYNPSTRKFKHYPISKFGVDNIRKVYVDRNNSLWVGCEYGGIVVLNPMTEEFHRFQPDKSPNSLISQNVFDFHEDRDGNMWIATFNGLDKYIRASGNFQHFSIANGLPGDMIYGILEDNHSNIWLTTTCGLSRYDIKTQQFTNYDEQAGLQSREFSEGAFVKIKQTGEFVVGGIKGFVTFHPDSIKLNKQAPEVVITNLKILYNQVPVGKMDDGRTILEHSVPYTKSVVLKHYDRIISIDFVALHFANPSRNQYQYKLEGFDKNWVKAPAFARTATYTNLSPGEYVFRVKASNCDNVWNATEATLNIKVLPPFWQTWWAYILYAITLAGLMIVFQNITVKRMKIANALKLDRLKREKAEELNLMKLNFFTNISHEFRTPLTLILAPLQKILNDNHDRPLRDFKQQFDNIYQNANKLLTLTNQVMDLRKLQTGKMRLQADETDLVDMIWNITVQFRDLADHRSIRFDFDKPDEPMIAWVDRKKLDRAIVNILSNALKFTENNKGHIKLKLRKGYSDEVIKSHYVTLGNLPAGDFIEISVEDNGIGIPNDLLTNIFEQFYQIDTNHSVQVQGTGIGLAITKEMIELHKGIILVKSTENVGSRFVIRIPSGKDHLAPHQFLDTTDTFENESFPEITPASSSLPSLTASENPDAATILVVEDNEDLRNFMIETLRPWYGVIDTADGKSGCEIAIQTPPDLIISDIMMPVMDGIELCKTIKSDIRTSHIPVILLTAKTSDEHRIAGYQAQADDYIVKPFNVDVLLSRINNLLESREMLRQMLQNGNFEAPKPTKGAMLSPLDQDFLNKLSDYITANLSNTDINVEKLCVDVGVSRSNLHLKLKALTNQSATEFIKTVRLKHAVDMLNEGRKNVHEISYSTGFNTPSYFIKCFKEKYGITPKEYSKNLFQTS